MVREWGPWGWSGTTFSNWSAESGKSGELTLHAGDRMFRDILSRNRDGKLGYAIFLGTVGCPRYRQEGSKVHWISGGGYGGDSNGTSAEYPLRPMARNAPVQAAAKPSCWIAACLTPVREYGGFEYDFRSHFGLRQAVPGGFRFNVVHLDGHVDDSVWKEPDVSTEWTTADPDYAGRGRRPYGWGYKPGGGTYQTEGIEDEPQWKGAFDTNM